MKLYRSPFLRDFWHLNVAMMTSNNALVPDPDKEDILASKPTDWPWLHLGLRMCGWGNTQTKYYLLGTPIIWWGGTLSLIASICVLGVYLLRQQRKYVDMDPRECLSLCFCDYCSFEILGEWAHFLYVGKIAFFGWALHYSKLLMCIYRHLSDLESSPVHGYGACNIRSSLRASIIS